MTEERADDLIKEMALDRVKQLDDRQVLKELSDSGVNSLRGSRGWRPRALPER